MKIQNMTRKKKKNKLFQKYVKKTNINKNVNKK